MTPDETTGQARGRGSLDVSLLPPVVGDWVRLDAKWSCQFSLVRGRIGCLWNARRPPTAKQMLKILDQYKCRPVRC